MKIILTMVLMAVTGLIIYTVKSIKEVLKELEKYD